MVAISASTFSPIFYKGTESNVNNFDIQEAAIILSTDTHKVFLDSDQSERIEVSDFISRYTEAQIIAKSAGAIYLNKIYRASDTNHLFVYTGTSGNYSALDITNFKVTSATSADYASHASTADMYHADVADNATNADTATYATNAGTATYATNAGTANYATNAGSATNAGTATYATNAGTANYAKGPANNSDWDFGVSSEFGSLSSLTS